MSAFAQSLAEEVNDLRDTRINALSSTVAERVAALAYDLERADKTVCDGFATATSPRLAAEQPVEVKSVRVEHHDGTGRLAVHPDSHAELVERGGCYVVVLYGEVDVDGATRIVVLEHDVVDAERVGRCFPSAASGYQKVRWDRLLDAEVDRARWSA